MIPARGFSSAEFFHCIETVLSYQLKKMKRATFHCVFKLPCVVDQGKTFVCKVVLLQVSNRNFEIGAIFPQAEIRCELRNTSVLWA